MKDEYITWILQVARHSIHYGIYLWSLQDHKELGQISNLFPSDFQQDEISWLTTSTSFSTTMINTEDMIWTEKQELKNKPNQPNESLGKSWNTLIS